MKNKVNSFRITISFSRKNIDIYDYLSKQDNVSKFVCNLVREKIEKSIESSDSLLKEKVMCIIDDYLANKKIILGENTEETSQGLGAEMTAAMDTFEF